MSRAVVLKKVHDKVSMIKSWEWDTADVFPELPDDSGNSNADDSHHEDVGRTINNFLGRQLIAHANVICYKDILLVENSLKDDLWQDDLQIQNKTKPKESPIDSSTSDGETKRTISVKQPFPETLTMKDMSSSFQEILQEKFPRIFF